MLTRPAPPPSDSYDYGPDPDQVIDCYAAANSPLPSVALVHGGYWRPEYDRAHARSAAAGLATAGFPTALIEYRRIPGDPAASVDDVASALHAVAGGSTRLPAGPVVVVGHSAGGHLALLGSRGPHTLGCLALAPVADLRMADDLHLDDDAVLAFLGGAAEHFPHLDPSRLGASPCPTVVLHGDADELVPLALSASFARQTGATLTVLPDVGHFAFIDPTSEVWPTVIDQLRGIARAAGIE